MNRFLALLLVLTMLFALTACGETDTGYPQGEQTAPVQSNEPEPLPEPSDDSDVEPNPIDPDDVDQPGASPDHDDTAPDPAMVDAVLESEDIPAPRGYYASENGEYAMFFAPNTTTAPAGELSLENNGEVSAWGDYRTEEVVYGGQVNYYIWLTIKGLDTPVDDIHIANYFPDDDVILQLEDIRVSDGALAIGCPPPDSDAASDFGAILTNQDGVE